MVSTIVAKTKEWLTAVELEQRYTKEEILRMYLNTVEYGSNAFGIKVAAKTFFNTSPDSLQPEQAAMLVGVLNNPTAYNPSFHPQAALRRRNVVLDRMGQAGVLPQAEIAALQGHAHRARLPRREAHRRPRYLLPQRHQPVCGCRGATAPATTCTATACKSTSPSTRACRPTPKRPCTSA